MKKIILLALVCSFASIGYSAPASADSYVGVYLGPSFVNNSIGTQFQFGGHIGTKLSPLFGLGFYGTYESLGSGSFVSGSNSASVSASETILAAEFNIYPMLDNGFYVGAKAGLGLTSGSATISVQGASASGSSTQTNFAVGPAAGYNFWLVPTFAVGAEVNYIIVTTSGSSLNALNTMATATLAF